MGQLDKFTAVMIEPTARTHTVFLAQTHDTASVQRAAHELAGIEGEVMPPIESERECVMLFVVVVRRRNYISI